MKLCRFNLTYWLLPIAFLFISCTRSKQESAVRGGPNQDYLASSGLTVTTDLTGWDCMIEPRAWADRNCRISETQKVCYETITAGLERAFKKMPPYQNSRFIGLRDQKKNLHALASYRLEKPDHVVLDFLVSRPPGTGVEKIKDSGAMLICETMKMNSGVYSMSLEAANKELIAHYKTRGFRTTKGYEMRVTREGLNCRF